MPTFAFEAVDKSGRAVSDTIDATSEEEARDLLRKKKLYPTSVSRKAKRGKKKKEAAASSSAGTERKKAAALGGVNQGQLTLFTRQFATLVDAGLPMVRALHILEDMLPPGVLRNAVMDVVDDVEQGSSLSEAMAKHPKCFDTLYVSMVRSGEVGGVLDTILNRLADFREKAQKLKKQVIGALVYPAAVILIATLILLLIIMFIIPKFEEMFSKMGVSLPTPTRLLLDFASVLQVYWYLIPIIPFVLIVGFKVVRSTKGGRYVIDMLSLYLPVFGVILRKSSISRFCRTLGTLLNAGVPLLDALGVLRTAVGNAVVEEAVSDVHTAIREGDNIADPLRRSGVFDSLAINMVAVGEETGELDKMLIKIADNYDNDVDALVAGMMNLLEPFLIVGMGLAVAFIVISLFLPMIELMKNIG